MHILTSLLLLIVVSRLLGRLLARAGQPALVGEILAGLLLGPAILNAVRVDESLTGIADLAIFFVVLSAGLEMNFKEVVSSFKGRGLLAAFISFIIPFIAGCLLGIAFQLDAMRVTFIGLVLAITALPVAVRILSSLGLLDTAIGRYSVASAIINDVLALLALGIVIDLPNLNSFSQIAWSIGATSLKLGALAVSILGFNYLVHRLKEKGFNIVRAPEQLIKIFGQEALLGIVVAFVLTFSAISDALGFHSILGAFFGALLIDKEFFLASRYKELEKTIASLTDGFLGPVFFAYIGLQLSFADSKSIGFVTSLIAIAVLSKVLAGYLSGRLVGLSNMESYGIGIISNGRGVMGLIIASIAIERGFIGTPLFSALVLMSVVTTVLVPIAFKRWVKLGQ